MLTGQMRKKIIAVARAETGKRGWLWLEPIEIQLVNSDPMNKIWLVQTNLHGLGCNARIYIRESDLMVLKAAYLPR